jgi:hypothetical protein
VILSIRPESGAVVPDWRDPVVIRFDEVIDEMASGGGAGGGSGLERQVILSPVAGDVRVSWRRSAIAAEPKEGWKRGRVYRLELLPGILDLRRNRVESGRTIIFSTGPAIPGASLAGTALHWTEQRTLGGALIQASLRPDTVPYVTVADSGGEFTLAGIPPGEYVVSATHDQNNNRRRDPREAYDTARVRVDSAATAVLWAFPHDTAGPRLRAVEPVDSVTLRLQFSQHLDPAEPADTSQVGLFTQADTTPVPIAAILTPDAYDSLRARERAADDSARRAREEGDTAAAGPPPAEQPAPPAAGPPPIRLAGPGGGGVPAQDTSRARQLLARRPVPSDRLVVRTAKPLEPEGRYLVRVKGVRNLSGAAGEGQQVFEMPKAPAAAPAPPPRDTTRVPPP